MASWVSPDLGVVPLAAGLMFVTLLCPEATPMLYGVAIKYMKDKNRRK